MRAWVNGQLLDRANAPAVAVTDHGFTVGDGCSRRSRWSTAAVRVDPPPRPAGQVREGLGLPAFDEAEVRRGVAAVLEGQELPLGRIRITYTGGEAPLGSGRGSNPPTLVVAAGAMEAWEGPTSVVTVPWPRNERGALAGLKTTSYGENVVALAYAAERHASEAIFAIIGNLCEGTGSNVFYVLDGELRTPTLASGCLAGISRALVLEWYGGREVDEPVDTRPARARCSSSPRRATCRRCVRATAASCPRRDRSPARWRVPGRARSARTSTRDRSSPRALASGDGASARRLRAAALAVGRDVQPVAPGARVAVALGAVAGEVHEDLVAVGGLAGAEAVALAE